MRSFALSILVTCALACILAAQAPMPVIVPAATPAGTLKASPTTPNADSVQSALKMLQSMKAANEETLRKQAATLELLDDVERAADQMRIFARRS